MVSTENIRGYLVIDVVEASGKSRDEAYVWDSTAFEGFVKVELRGGPRNVKVQSKKVPVLATNIVWKEKLVLEVLDGSNELRLMLCREKFSGSKRGTSVIAACGIFVNDILEAVPIDKYFELFKPNGGGDGGFIRITLDFKTDASLIPEAAAANGEFPSITSVPRGPMASLQEDGAHEPAAAQQAAAAAAAPAPKRKKRRSLLLSLLLLVAAGAAGGGAYYLTEQQKGKKKAGSSSTKK